MNEKELMSLIRSANINPNEITASQIQDMIKNVSKEKEQMVVAVWGEPAEVHKKDRKGVYYRYKPSKKRGLKKEIFAKDRMEVILKAYNILFGEETISLDYTVEEVYQEWHKQRKETVATTTYIREERDWNNIKDFPIIKRKIRDITVPILKNMLDLYCGDHKVTDKDLKNKLSLLRNIWQYGAVLGVVSVMVPELLKCKLFKTKQPKSDEEKRNEVYTRDETIRLRRYLESKKRDTYENAILFATYSGGLRIAEFRALKWEDYDSEYGKLRVYNQMVRREDDKGHMYATVRVGNTKGNARKGRRIINLSTPAQRIIEEMRLINGDKEYIFQSKGNLPIGENRINVRIKQCCEVSGIRYFSCHKFRFRFASDCYEAGVPERETQETMGHSDIRTTHGYDLSNKASISHELMDSITNY